MAHEDHRRSKVKTPSSRRWKFTAALAAFGLAGALMAGCASGAGASSAGGSGEPKQGGDLTFLINNFDAGWVANESAISSYEGNVWDSITDKLVYVDPDGNISPWLAESWENNSDSTEFTLHLKNGVTFSDGTAFDAAAVVRNLDYWARGDEAKGVKRIGLFPSSTYQTAEAVDDSTVKVTFNAPTLGFIPTLGYHGSILTSPKTLDLSKEQQADLKNYSGTGPFVVDSWTEGDNVVLKKRDDYNWAYDNAKHTGPAYLDTITYKIVKEDSIRSSSVESGQADVAYNISPQEISRLKSAGFTVETPKYLGFSHGFKVSTKAENFDDVRVRQAVQVGIDRDEILQTVYTDDWDKATSFLQSNVPEATDNSDLLTYDKAKAESLLDEAGWVKGADGVRTKDGKTLDLDLYPTTYINTASQIDEIIARQLGDIGFKVTQQKLDTAAYLDRVDTNPAIPLRDVTRSFIDVGTVAGVLTSAKSGEDWFAVGESDAKLNELSSGIATASDEAQRKTLVAELQRYVLEQGYYIPIEQIVQRIYLETPKLHGVSFNGIAYANFYDAWKE
ncbi:ABC transporter substrate-binding protein [Pseudoclavibacter sp. 13-3]|uniref:ABC transporter substrate-binding protein n=1 Tax=Pseudoclavibacter sp. 13-3 TaxID=2901228 RepID=UPI001E42EE6B|nr:ABC transporter substrate-binding protein [Pseudoclavibacter sp. 13-3]MCD7101426.1 ABC transporter substrate-binding protein [Pseudoclavibacter sp. 13-3]